MGSVEIAANEERSKPVGHVWRPRVAPGLLPVLVRRLVQGGVGDVGLGVGVQGGVGGGVVVL